VQVLVRTCEVKEDDMGHIDTSAPSVAGTGTNAEQGLLWVEAKQAELDALPTGTVVVIEIATGNYVTGMAGLEAHTRFTERFGEAAPGFVYRVRDITFIGGGLG
jgi:hypothetical protein